MSGVLLYTEWNNKLYFFIQLVRYGETYSIEDFGGSKDDQENFITSAKREFIEETNGQFTLVYPSPQKEIQYILSNFKETVLLLNYRYVLYICKVPNQYMRSIDCDIFDNREYHDNIQRVCQWITKDKLKSYISQGLSHPRLQTNFLYWLNDK